jgi:hypothetical protein
MWHPSKKKGKKSHLVNQLLLFGTVLPADGLELFGSFPQ